MARLPRPKIKLADDLRVILRQVGELWPERVIAEARNGRRLQVTRDAKLSELAALLLCDVTDLELDHDPALENREKLVLLPSGKKASVTIPPPGAKVLRYYPDANDPEHLKYRPKRPEQDGSHYVKTHVRGDHGQLSDNALARKEKRRLKKAARKGRPRRGKRNSPTRRLRSGSRWPPKGSRKVNWRKSAR